jgi:hypothetical protein
VSLMLLTTEETRALRFGHVVERVDSGSIECERS